MLPIYRVDAFTLNGKGGNPAGVVPNADFLTTAEMQLIAKQLGFSETAFILSDKECDFHLRFFTPNQEVDFCGHATVASFSLLLEHQHITPGNYRQKTKAGKLGVDVKPNGYVLMQQRLPTFLKTLDGQDVAIAVVNAV